MFAFRAKAIAAVELPEALPDIFVVTFAENPDGRGQEFELQRGLSFDAQDRRLGQDTYCLVRDAGDATAYGGVLSWRVHGSRLELSLDVDAAAKIGDSQVTIELDCEGMSRRALLEALERVLGFASET